MKGINDLTRQETNILALIARGRRNAEIAQELYMSVRTVESHLYNIFKKLEISSRTEAAIYVFENGLFSKPESSGITYNNSVELHMTRNIETTTIKS
jgi:DNA-binding CsgD family transcriptional regulator